MQPTSHSDFPTLFSDIDQRFKKFSKKIHTSRWQGMDISKHPEMASHEILNFDFNITLPTEDLDYYRRWVKPNLPWADDHFLERVCGVPLNPAKEWANWPWAKHADKFRDKQKFNHNYLERYWPKYAGMTETGSLPIGVYTPHRGIRHEYGDLDDVVKLIANEPDTRQAWLPIFFPEDTGVGDGGRKPCTLGYQFIMREKQLHVYYPLRSCDYYRHFRDDVYLTVRLLLWVLDKARQINGAFWDDVSPGTLSMHCTSFHVFANDYIVLFKDKK